MPRLGQPPEGYWFESSPRSLFHLSEPGSAIGHAAIPRPTIITRYQQIVGRRADMKSTDLDGP